MEMKSFSIVSRGEMHRFCRPVVMGILNVTSDSFYDGGRYTNEKAMLEHAEEMLEQGADVIDVGVMSSRPGAMMLDPSTEAQRLSAVVATLRKHWPQALLSVDTCQSLPARAAVEAGADIINDIGGGSLDQQMFSTVAELQVPYILMHMRGVPQTMQQLTNYDDIVEDLSVYFSQRLHQLHLMGVKDVWLDPGFGFAKTVDDNHLLLHNIDQLCNLFEQPMVAALSRKSMIYKRLDTTPDHALYGTIALDTVALMKGCRVLRVHDVKPAVDTVRLLFDSPNPSVS
ncbi:MAG: dihydropteroate synthase [Bacteroidales bacterium]|nr:dihydropteroate synthase [Bacteroidales bacterium]